jgi:DnaJ-class molecular chaperone
MMNDDCLKCHGTGLVKEKDGTIHTCFDCLAKGRMDQHDKNIKSAEELRIKL